MSLNRLCQHLGHSFNRPQLLEEALSHRSFHGRNNERLEYLGDAVLNFVVAATLFRQNPRATEGELSRLRASLVCATYLTSLAQSFELGQYLRLGAGELKTGGAQRSSILADAMEAVIGAIYLDASLTVCEACISKWYGVCLTKASLTQETKDAKTRLQEYVQAHQLPLPTYTILAIEGPPHQQLFEVECSLLMLKTKALGVGANRRQAEQKAATILLAELTGTVDFSTLPKPI